jgi:hypothetical protein
MISGAFPIGLCQGEGGKKEKAIDNAYPSPFLLVMSVAPTTNRKGNKNYLDSQADILNL